MNMRGQGSGLELRELAEKASGAFFARRTDNRRIYLCVVDIRVTKPVFDEMQVGAGLKQVRSDRCACGK
jgi:hypothetical protein